MRYGFINMKADYRSPEYQKNIITDSYPDAVIREVDDYATLLSICNENDSLVISDLMVLYDMSIKDDVDYIFNTIYDRYQEIFNKGVDLIIIDQSFLNSEIYKTAIQNNNDPKNYAAYAVSYVLKEQIYAVVKMLITRSTQRKESIKTGIKNKGSTGRKKGDTFVTRKERESKAFILENLIDFGGNMTNIEIMEELGLARNTYYKYKRELRSEDHPDVSDDSITSLYPHSSTPEDKGNIIEEEVKEIVPEDTIQEEKEPEMPKKKASKKAGNDDDDIEGQTSIFEFL